MIEKRSVAVSIILTIVTCGIYGIYWMIKLNDEINQTANETTATSGGMVFLFSLITCGIYGLYWLYKMGERLDNIYVERGMVSQSRGILYIILGVLGFAVIAYALMQDSLNKVSD